jgi:hypothetical protein
MNNETNTTTATDHLLGFCPEATDEPAPETKRSAESAPAPKAKAPDGGNGYPFQTKREICARLETDSGYRHSCLIVLYERQTADEQETKETKWKNRRGFMSSHAVNGTKLAEKLIAGEQLTDEEEDKLAGIVCRYGKQLAAHFRAQATAADPAKAEQAACFFGG